MKRVMLLILVFLSSLDCAGGVRNNLQVTIKTDGCPNHMQALLEGGKNLRVHVLSIESPLRYEPLSSVKDTSNLDFPRLNNLRIEGAGYFFAPAPQFSELFLKYFSRSPLKKLTISGGWIYPVHMRQLAQATFAQNLEVLELVNVKFHLDLKDGRHVSGGDLSWLGKFPNLRVLKIVECRVGDCEMQTLPLEKFPYLKEINISGNAQGACDVICAKVKQAKRTIKVHGRGMFTIPYFKNLPARGYGYYSPDTIKPWQSGVHYRTMPRCTCGSMIQDFFTVPE
ncbi:MAG: hypothetical protein H6849_00995 [Alphaproteobacteria bacterium]|nr:MAG: hypothetical protein H6849_00995 [Alphaproteobacteria bacterium]